MATVTVEDSLASENALEGGTGPIVTQQAFLIRTEPSSARYATLANGTHSGTAVDHHGQPGIAVNSDRPVPIVTDVNPNTGVLGTADGIRLHTAGGGNFTGVSARGPVSAGCQVICTSQYSNFLEFTGLRPVAGPQQKAFTVKVYTNENVSRRTR